MPQGRARHAPGHSSPTRPLWLTRPSRSSLTGSARRSAPAITAIAPRRSALLFLYREVLAVLGKLDGVPRLMAFLLYGAGLRLLECCRLRVKDVDFGMNQLLIRDGKGGKDRATMLPAAVKAGLTHHIDRM